MINKVLTKHTTLGSGKPPYISYFDQQISGIFNNIINPFEIEANLNLEKYLDLLVRKVEHVLEEGSS